MLISVTVIGLLFDDILVDISHTAALSGLLVLHYLIAVDKETVAKPMLRVGAASFLYVFIFLVGGKYLRLTVMQSGTVTVADYLLEDFLTVAEEHRHIAVSDTCTDKTLYIIRSRPRRHLETIVPQNVAPGVELGKHGMRVGIS